MEPVYWPGADTDMAEESGAPPLTEYTTNIAPMPSGSVASMVTLTLSDDVGSGLSTARLASAGPVFAMLAAFGVGVPSKRSAPELLVSLPLLLRPRDSPTPGNPMYASLSLVPTPVQASATQSAVRYSITSTTVPPPPGVPL
jgi:hypothetical protein